MTGPINLLVKVEQNILVSEPNTGLPSGFLAQEIVTVLVKECSKSAEKLKKILRK